MTDKDEQKEEFLRVLAGTNINWKEYAMHLMHNISMAEIREKEFVWESRYFYEQDEATNKEMGFTDEQREYICDTYMEWLEKHDKV